MQCGRHSFPFELLETFALNCAEGKYGHWHKALTAISNFGTRYSYDSNQARPHLLHARLVADLRNKKKLTTTALCNHLRSLQCSNPQDCVRSVLGFLDASTADAVTNIPYTSTNELYTWVAKLALRNGELDHLGAAGLAQQRRNYRSAPTAHDSSELPIHVPSWVPDWTFVTLLTSLWRNNRSCLSVTSQPLCSAGGQICSDALRMVFESDDRILCIEGIIFDEVLCCGNVLPRYTIPDTASEISLTAKRSVIDRALDLIRKFIDESRKMSHITLEMSLTAKRSVVGGGLEVLHKFIDESREMAKACESTYGLDGLELALRHTLVGGMIPAAPERWPTAALMVRASDDAVNFMFELHTTLVRVLDELRWALESARKNSNQLRTDDEMHRIREAIALSESMDGTRVYAPFFEWALAQAKLQALSVQRLSQGSALAPEDFKQVKHAIARAQESDKQAMPASDLITLIPEACKTRRFSVTKDKLYMGVGPDITMPGDKLCVIPGCCAPFVIRPKGKHYQLVGECYVHGVMDGEIMAQSNVAMEALLFE